VQAALKEEAEAARAAAAAKVAHDRLTQVRALAEEKDRAAVRHCPAAAAAPSARAAAHAGPAHWEAQRAFGGKSWA